MLVHLMASSSGHEPMQTATRSLAGSGVEKGHSRAAAARSKATTGCDAAAVDFLHKNVH